MPSKEAIQSTVVAYCAALGAMDADAVAEAFASDGVSHDPVGTAPHAGRDAIRQFMQSRLTAAERVSFTPNQIFVAGDSAAFKWTAQLTTKQGQSVGVEGIDVIHLSDDGKIQTLHAYWDPTPVLAAQLNSPAADDWCACIVGSRRSAMSLSALGGLTQQELEERARRSAHGSQEPERRRSSINERAARGPAAIWRGVPSATHCAGRDLQTLGPVVGEKPNEHLKGAVNDDAGRSRWDQGRIPG